MFYFLTIKSFHSQAAFVIIRSITAQIIVHATIIIQNHCHEASFGLTKSQSAIKSETIAQIFAHLKTG
jgi:hypothetical protein